jgi:hypothetical protein
VVGTANSDSHEPDAEEPGYPRSYVRVSDDNPRQVTGRDIVAGFLAGDVLMTNGPFVQVIATSGTSSVGMGETLTVAAGQVHITVEVRHAPWVLPNRARLYHDGIIVAEASLTPDGSGILPAEFDVDVTRDGFLVIEVTGDDNMFPSVYPQEVPSLQFTDVIGALGDSFGFLGGSGLQPTLTYQVTPYALTNPIYLDGDGDGTVTPQLTLTGVSNLEARAPTATVVSPPTASLGDPPLLDARPPWQRYRDALPARKRRALEQRLPEWLWPTDHPKDIRRVFAQFARHAH